MASDRQFIISLAKRIARRGRTLVLPKIPSRTLRRALRLESSEAAKRAVTKLHIPHYWAVYVHDGRGAFGPRNSRVLVWYENPADDPRGRTPERASQIRRLTKSQFEAALREWREARKQGRKSRVRIARRSGPVAPSRFFSNEPGGGMSSLLNTVRPDSQARARQHMLTKMKKELGISSFVPKSIGGITFKRQKLSMEITL